MAVIRPCLYSNIDFDFDSLYDFSARGCGRDLSPAGPCSARSGSRNFDKNLSSATITAEGSPEVNSVRARFSTSTFSEHTAPTAPIVIDLTNEDTENLPPLSPLPPSRQMPAWRSETPEDPDLDSLVVPTTAPDNPKPQRPRRALFRNRPSWAKRCWTPDEDKTIEPPSSRAGAVNSVERSASPEVAESVDEADHPGGENVSGRSSAGSANPATDDGTPILESRPPAESNPRSLPCSDGSGDCSDVPVPESTQRSAEMEGCLSPGASAAAVERGDQVARDEPTVSARSVLRVVDHDARLGEAASPQMMTTVDFSGNTVENIEMKVDLSSFQVSAVLDHQPSSNQYLVVPEPLWAAAHVVENMSGGAAGVRFYHRRKTREERLSTLRKRRRTLSQTQG